MKRVITNIYTAFVVLVLVALAGWSVLSLMNNRAVNLDVFEKESSGFTEQMEELLASGDVIQSDNFSRLINDFFNDEKRLNALVIYSHDKGVLYQKAVSQNEALISLLNQAPSLQVPLEYKINEMFFRKYTTGFNLDGVTGTDIDYIYELTGREDIYLYLRICLIGVIALFFLTILMILIVPRMKDSDNSASETDRDNSVEEFENELMASSRYDESDNEIGTDETEFSIDAPGTGNDYSSESSFDDDFDSSFDNDSFSSEPDIPSSEDLQAMDHELSGDTDEDFDSGMDFDDDLSSENGDSSFDMPEDNDLDFPDDGSDDDFDFSSDEGDSLEMPEETENTANDLSFPEDDNDDFSFGDDDSDDFSFDDENDDLSDMPTSEDEISFDEVDDEAGNNANENISFDESDSDFDLETPVSPSEDVNISNNPVNPMDDLEDKLGLELERAASFNQDLVFISLNDKSLSAAGTYSELAELLINLFNYKDLIFGDGVDTFALIQLNMSLDEGISRMEQLSREWKENHPSEALMIGMSSRNGRLISEKRLMKEAGSALKKADADKSIIAFRSDPEKFREFISKDE